MDDLNLPFQIPIDEDYADAEGEDVDDADSALSIASSRFNAHWEHGRRFPDYRSTGYVFPVGDEGSQNVEKYFHAMMLTVLDDKHFFAPVRVDRLQDVLDVATGLGLWAQDVADAYPDCNIIGMDTQPNTTTSPNLQFLLADITEDWIFDNADIKFDYIHLRSLFATLSEEQWPMLYQQSFSFMKSGGWIEQIEIDINCHCDDNTKKPNSTIFQLAEATSRIAQAVDRDFQVERMAVLIREAGFLDVQERQYKLPLGAWSADQRYKTIGNLFEGYYKTGLQGWLMAALTRRLNYTHSEVDNLCKRAIEELDSHQHHYYFYLRVVIGRKP